MRSAPILVILLGTALAACGGPPDIQPGGTADNAPVAAPDLVPLGPVVAAAAVTGAATDPGPATLSRAAALDARAAALRGATLQ